MKVVEELIVFHRIGESVKLNEKIRKAFCQLDHKYFSYVNLKLSDLKVQSMLNSDSEEDFNKLVLISQI